MSIAALLRQAGHNVIVLEARERIGGRIRTDYQYGVPIDMGASYVLLLEYHVKLEQVHDQTLA